MKRPGKRAKRRNRGKGRIQHRDGIWRQPKKVWALQARHESGRSWFIWMLMDEKVACSPKISHAIDEAFQADALKDPDEDIPTTEVE